MTTMSEGYVALVLGMTLVLLLLVRLRAELVALLVLIALEIPGVLTRDEALSGFSNSAVITIIGLFVISAALERTGVAEQMSTLLVRLGGTSERRLIALVMLTAATLSLVMNNIAAGAVVLPAVVLTGRRANIAPSKLLMPLAFGASLGGMATIFTTANILISNTLRDSGAARLSFFDFFPIGGLLVLAGIAYMVLLGYRLLPDGDPLAQVAQGAPLAEVYRLQDRLWEVQLPADSPLADRSLAEINLGGRYGLTAVAVFHGQSALLTPGPTTQVAPGDVLLVAGREAQVRQLPGVQIGRETRAAGYLSNPQVQLAEVVIAPRASLLGQTLKDLGFRQRYGVTVIAMWHAGQARRTGVGEIPLAAGDALLVVGPPDRLLQLRENPALVVVTELTEPPRQQRPDRRRYALAISALVLSLATIQWLPTSIAVLLGVVLLVLSRCLTMDEALGAIEWKTVFVIAGMLPLSIAMEKTGLAATLGQVAVQLIGGYGFMVLASGLFISTALLTQVLGGQVTALVMGPIVIAAATSSGVSAHSIGIIVAIACSASFLTPLAHPVNLLTVGPGGYSYRDFARVGAGLLLVCILVISACAAWLPG